MTEHEFHKAADALIEAFEMGDVTYEESFATLLPPRCYGFDMAYEGLL